MMPRIDGPLPSQSLHPFSQLPRYTRVTGQDSPLPTNTRGLKPFGPQGHHAAGLRTDREPKRRPLSCTSPLELFLEPHSRVGSVLVFTSLHRNSAKLGNRSKNISTVPSIGRRLSVLFRVCGQTSSASHTPRSPADHLNPSSVLGYKTCLRGSPR